MILLFVWIRLRSSFGSFHCTAALLSTDFQWMFPLASAHCMSLCQSHCGEKYYSMILPLLHNVEAYSLIISFFDLISLYSMENLLNYSIVLLPAVEFSTFTRKIWIIARLIIFVSIIPAFYFSFWRFSWFLIKTNDAVFTDTYWLLQFCLFDFFKISKQMILSWKTK